MGLILATTACQDSLEVPVQETPTDPTHLRIEVTSNDETKALVSGKYLPSGSKIGVYFQGDGSNGEYDGNLYQNVFVTASGSDASQTWTIDPSHCPGAKDAPMPTTPTMWMPAHLPLSTFPLQTGTTTCLQYLWMVSAPPNRRPGSP